MKIKKDVVTLLVLAVIFALLAVAFPDYSKACLGMFMGATSFFATQNLVSILGGEKDAQ